MNKMLFVSKEFSENLDSSVTPHLESDVFERSRSYSCYVPSEWRGKVDSGSWSKTLDFKSWLQIFLVA